MKARVIRGVALASALAVSGTACAPHQDAPPTPPPIAVDTTRLERRTIATYENLDGTVTPYLQANLAPQQSGTLVAIYANEGDRVHRGETLAKIDDSILRATLTQQQGADQQAVAKLAQSTIQLPITNVTANSGVVQARRALQEAKKTQTADAANVTNTKLTFDADGALLHQGFVAESVYEQARATYVAAEQTLASDNDKIAQAQAALDTAEQNLATTPLQRQVIAENRGAVVQSEGSVSQSETAVAQTTIVAPFDGVVTARNLDPGSFASPSQAIYAISQIDPVYVDFNVKDTDLAYVQPGTSVTFTTSANPSRRYSGRVATVDAVPAPGTLLYRARIVEGDPDFSLRGGLEVTVRVAKSVRSNVLAVPRAAVVQNGANGSIYAVDSSSGNAVAKALTVKLGSQTSDEIEVSGSGLRAGMRIVVGQTDNLHDGAPLAVDSPSPSPH
jgi:RND family efflux transporter MFP subunit